MSLVRVIDMRNTLRVAIACPKKWDDLIGSSDRRFCEHCQKDVHNLSVATRAETMRLTRQVEAGGRVCVAYFINPDRKELRRRSKVRRWATSLQSILAMVFPFGMLGINRVQAEPPAKNSEHRQARLSAAGEIILGKVAAPPSPKPTPPMIRGEAGVTQPILGDAMISPKASPKPKK